MPTRGGLGRLPCLVFVLVAFSGFLAARAADPKGMSASEFAGKMASVLPREQPYAFLKDLEQGFERPRRNLAATPTSTEMRIADQGWRVVFASRSSDVLRGAVDEFQVYLNQSMGVRVFLDPRDAKAGWTGERNAVVVGTRAELAECAAPLRGSKDYRLQVSADRIVVCGFDDRGAMHGLYHVETRMNLREAPFLPLRLDTVRHSLYATRMTLSGLGWMDWPDAYLSMLAHYGFDAIFTSEYANPTGAEGPRLYAAFREQSPQRLRDVIRRAARYGIDVYCPLLYQLRGDESDETGLRALVRQTVAAFPEIRGYVLLSEGFMYGNELPQWDWGAARTRAWIVQWTRGIRIATQEFHALDPSIRVLPWDYVIDPRPNAVDLKRAVIRDYPDSVTPLLTWDRGKRLERDGEVGYLKDYAINEPGPAETTAAQLGEVRRRGLRVFVKADTSASWQFGTFPYIPAPDQWLRRYDALARARVDGVLESWTSGFQPNFVAELRNWLSWSDAPPAADLLDAIARRDFSAEAAPFAVSAWKNFSEAVRLVPDTGPNFGTNNAIGAPLFLDEPQPRALSGDRSWYRLGLSHGNLAVGSRWPFAVSRLILEPDFSNRTNAAETYSQPFGLPTFIKYLVAAADRFESGLAEYREAAIRAAPEKRKEAAREVFLVEQLQRMLRSEVAVLTFEDLRFQLARVRTSEIRRDILGRLQTIATEEIARTEASLQAAERDSRLGYEWEENYVYSPSALEAKLEQLRHVRDIEIPGRLRTGSQAPETPTIRGPARPVSVTAWSRFGFRAQGAADFECSVDDAAFVRCGELFYVPFLADGDHSLRVRAIGPTGETSPPEIYRWSVDAQTPVVAFVSGPKAPVSNQHEAQFAFVSSKAGVTLLCRMATDPAPTACFSPHVVRNLSDGLHSFEIRAVDKMGRASVPVAFTWIVDPGAR